MGVEPDDEEELPEPDCELLAHPSRNAQYEAKKATESLKTKGFIATSRTAAISWLQLRTYTKTFPGVLEELPVSKQP
jgi:hypothetical protein